MANRSGKPHRPRDPNQLGKFLVELATGQRTEEPAPVDEDPAKAAARLLGRKGGMKGGKARARKLSKAKLSAIGKKGARARWKGR